MIGLMLIFNLIIKMNKKYHIFVFFPVIILGFLLSLYACNKEDNRTMCKKQITALKCSFPSNQNPLTKTQYEFADNKLKVSWSPGDEIAVSDGTSLYKFKQTGEITDEGHTALFTCNTPISFEGDSIIAVYPYADTLAFDLSQQSGNLEDISQNDILIAQAKISQNEEVGVIFFKPLCAIARFPKGTYVADSDFSGALQLNFSDENNGKFANILSIEKVNGIKVNYYTQLEDRVKVGETEVFKNIAINVKVENGRLFDDYYLAFIPNPNYNNPIFSVVTDRWYSFSTKGVISSSSIYTFSSFKYVDVKPSSLSLSKDKNVIYVTVLTNRECKISSSVSWMRCETKTITPTTNGVSSHTLKIEVDRNYDYYPRGGVINIDGNFNAMTLKHVSIHQDSEPIPDGSAEIQIHYMEPIYNISDNNITAVYVNGNRFYSYNYPYNNATSNTLYPYNGIPGMEIGKFIVTKAGLSNIKFYRNDELVYNKDVNLKVGRQNLVIYDLTKEPLVYDNGYPYWGEDVSDKDTVFKINFFNFLYEVPGVPYSGKLQYQANRNGESEWFNIGKPVAWGECTGLQTITIHPVANSTSLNQRINYRIVTESGDPLTKWDKNSNYVTYSDYWTAYNKRVCLHFLRGYRSYQPMANVSQWISFK